MARKRIDKAIPPPSKELLEIQQEDLTAEPSLDRMLEGVDLADPRLMRLFARLLAEKKDDE